jgi:hypothetical protein
MMIAEIAELVDSVVFVERIRSRLSKRHLDFEACETSVVWSDVMGL